MKQLILLPSVTLNILLVGKATKFHSIVKLSVNYVATQGDEK